MSILMLRELCIKNFAIIDDLEIRFSDGLTILSGETGAGKSIIINAVNLLLGSRATARLIRSGGSAAELSARFSVEPGGTLCGMMADMGFEAPQTLSIKRIVSATERHRIYINARPATLQQLTQLTRNLASISGQHAHQGLLDEDQQLRILDQYGGLLPMREALCAIHRRIVPQIKKLEELENLQKRRDDQMDLLRFQQQEIQRAGIAPGEDDALAKEIARLKNAEMLQQTLHAGIETLYSDQGAVLERLVETRRRLEGAREIDPALDAAIAPLKEAAYQIEDSVERLRTYVEGIQHDEARLRQAEDRLDVLHRLKRKYGGSIEAIFERERSIAASLAHIEHLDASIDAVRQALCEDSAALKEQSRLLTEKRRLAADQLARGVARELDSLKLSPAEFEVCLTPLEADNHTSFFLAADGVLLTETGGDQATFLISPNVGEVPKPLSDIASGGELSRVVLALKALLAASEAVGTIVFDEVDAGIGGGVAEVVGKKLRDLAERHQVICITHLPQIAKFADHHYRIFKTVAGGRTSTRIVQLTGDERVKEIARMLGGETITAKTLAHAREMLTT